MTLYVASHGFPPAGYCCENVVLLTAPGGISYDFPAFVNVPPLEISCDQPDDTLTKLQIAIDKKRRMERKEDSNEEPKLISTHPQLQKKDAQTKAAKTPPMRTKMSMISTLRDLRVNHARPGRAD
jgi:hypothetical protein